MMNTRRGLRVRDGVESVVEKTSFPSEILGPPPVYSPTSTIKSSSVPVSSEQPVLLSTTTTQGAEDPLEIPKNLYSAEVKDEVPSLPTSISSITQERNEVISSIFADETSPVLTELNSPSEEQEKANPVRVKWTQEEDRILTERVESQVYGDEGHIQWPVLLSDVETVLPGRTVSQCKNRWLRVLNPKLRKGRWEPYEDELLLELVVNCGKRWSKIAKYLPGRLAKQARERYVNHLDPNLRSDEISPSEKTKILELRAKMGNQWAAIARELPGRSENQIKNFFNWNIARDTEKKNKRSLSYTNHESEPKKVKRATDKKKIPKSISNSGPSLPIATHNPPQTGNLYDMGPYSMPLFPQYHMYGNQLMGFLPPPAQPPYPQERFPFIHHDGQIYAPNYGYASFSHQ